MARKHFKGLAVTLAMVLAVGSTPVATTQAATKKLNFAKKTYTVTGKKGKTVTVKKTKVSKLKKNVKVKWTITGNAKKYVSFKKGKKKVTETVKTTKAKQLTNKLYVYKKAAKKVTGNVVATFKIGKKTYKCTSKLTVKKYTAKTNVAPTTTPSVAPSTTPNITPDQSPITTPSTQPSTSPDVVGKTITLTAADVKDGKVAVTGEYANVNVAASVGTATVDVDDAKITGKLTLEGGAGYTVNLKKAEVADIAVTTSAAMTTKDAKATVPTINIESDATVSGGITVSESVIIKGKKKINKVTVNAKVEVTIAAPVKEVEVTETAKGTEVKVETGAVVDTLTVKAEDTTINGGGKITDVKVEANNTKISGVTTEKIEVGATVTGTTNNGTTLKPGSTTVNKPSSGGSSSGGSSSGGSSSGGSSSGGSTTTPTTEPTETPAGTTTPTTPATTAEVELVSGQSFTIKAASDKGIEFLSVNKEEISKVVTDSAIKVADGKLTLTSVSGSATTVKASGNYTSLVKVGDVKELGTYTLSGSAVVSGSSVVTTAAITVGSNEYVVSLAAIVKGETAAVTGAAVNDKIAATQYGTFKEYDFDKFFIITKKVEDDVIVTLCEKENTVVSEVAIAKEEIAK